MLPFLQLFTLQRNYILIKKRVELSEVSLLGKICHLNDSTQFYIDLVGNVAVYFHQ